MAVTHIALNFTLWNKCCNRVNNNNINRTAAYGPESSGKTTLALHCIAEAQKLGGDAAFVDAEHALDPVYAANLGVDVDSLIVSQPDFGEQALEITEQLVSSGAVERA